MKNLIIEFESVWDSESKSYSRLGNSNIKLDTEKYKTATPEDLSGLTIAEKFDLVERANCLTSFLNNSARKFIRKETTILV